jgi:PadR family transcriptional regulator, regulatory protein PadR
VATTRIVSEQTARVLDLFLREPAKPRFGRDIIVGASIKSGSLYPILGRLEERGILEARWEGLDVARRDGRQPRVEYLLAGDGSGARRLLDERNASIRRRSVSRPLPATA